jgi:histidinol-phosphatase (PHP family)
LKLGGDFVLSDDCHSVAQVGTCYNQVPAFLEETGIDCLIVLEKGDTTKDDRFPGISPRRVPTSILSSHID